MCSVICKSAINSEVYIPYLSELKLGSNTHRGSNICWVVQQNERNICLGPFKCRVPKLLNFISLKMVPNVKEISFSISLLMFASPFWMLLQSIVYSIFITFVVFPQWDARTSFATPVSEWSPYTFINMLASNYAIKLLNTGTSTCHYTLDR